MIETKLVTITPDFARQLLSTNKNNRKVKSSNVVNIVNDILSGKWQVNGESIKVDINGKMIDGQHRCLAIVKSNKAVETLLVSGLSPENYKTIDLRCVKRSLPDVLYMQGVTQSISKTATIGVVYSILTGSFPYRSERFGYPQLSVDIANVIMASFDINKWSNLYRDEMRQFKASGFTSTMFAGISCLAEKIDIAKCDKFAQMVITGEMLNKTDPVYHLRGRMYKEAIAKTKIDSIEAWALIVKAWNYFYEDKPLKTLRWTREVETSFPAISGLEKADIDWDMLKGLVLKTSNNSSEKNNG